MGFKHAENRYSGPIAFSAPLEGAGTAGRHRYVLVPKVVATCGPVVEGTVAGEAFSSRLHAVGRGKLLLRVPTVPSQQLGQRLEFVVRRGSLAPTADRK